MIIARAPLRLPLGGGATDLPSYYRHYGGRLITSSINKYIYVFINKPPIPDKIKLHYSQIEYVDNVSEIKHGIIRECLKLFEINHPIEITSMADFGSGTGMGSSSSFTVALIAGLAQYTGQEFTKPLIAETACSVEIGLLGNPIGKQDQYASAMGGINELIIDTIGGVTVNPLIINEFDLYEIENSLMMFYTGVQRDANAVLADQGEKIRDDASAMHRIKEIGGSIKGALLSCDIEGLGSLMHEHWMVKKSISNKMSSDEFDSIYNQALYHGALGGKIMGAGGGGLFLFCVKRDSARELRTSMVNIGLTYVDFKFEFDGVKIIAL